MALKDSIVYPARPIRIQDDFMRGDLVHMLLAQVFPSWSTTRISRWLGVNARTMQRWLSLGRGTVPEEELPPELLHRIQAMAKTMEDTGFPDALDHFIAQWQGNGIDNEVMAAWMADRYAKLIGREID